MAQERNADMESNLSSQDLSDKFHKAKANQQQHCLFTYVGCRATVADALVGEVLCGADGCRAVACRLLLSLARCERRHRVIVAAGAGTDIKRAAGRRKLNAVDCNHKRSLSCWESHYGGDCLRTHRREPCSCHRPDLPRCRAGLTQRQSPSSRSLLTESRSHPGQGDGGNCRHSLLFHPTSLVRHHQPERCPL